jgi:integrase
MASISTKKKNGKPVEYNIQWYEDKKRRTVSLSAKRYSKKTAEECKDIVEKLRYYRHNDSIPDKKTALWLEEAHEHLLSKLVEAGLMEIAEPKVIQDLWDSFFKNRTDLKPTTVAIYCSAQKRFYEQFQPTEFIDAMTSDRLMALKLSLLTNLTQASVCIYMSKIKTVLKWGVEQDWLAKNPLNGIPLGRGINRDNDRIITMEDYAKLLEACPNQEWRTIIALARIGGLRCPSELKQLRWSDIDWKGNRFLVRSLKAGTDTSSSGTVGKTLRSVHP